MENFPLPSVSTFALSNGSADEALPPVPAAYSEMLAPLIGWWPPCTLPLSATAGLTLDEPE
jgi:hypothetical protein